jgi:DNA-binding phage protein
MRTQEAIEHFGGATKLAEALGLTRDAIYKWGAYPPNETQYKIMVLSGGRLAVTNDNTKQENKND